MSDKQQAGHVLFEDFSDFGFVWYHVVVKCKTDFWFTIDYLDSDKNLCVQIWPGISSLAKRNFRTKGQCLHCLSVFPDN